MATAGALVPVPDVGVGSEDASRTGGLVAGAAGSGESMGQWFDDMGASAAARELMGEDQVFHVDMPRFALPSISSLLPEYTNSEQDFIRRAFHAGNYDMLRCLPADIRNEEVTRHRRNAMEAVHQFSAASVLPDGTRAPSLPKGTNGQGLFKAFEYIPSRYDLPREAASKDRMESEEKIAKISGRNFQLCGFLCKAKCEDAFDYGLPYPYLSDPYEAGEETRRIEKSAQDSRVLYGPFIPPGVSKLPEVPTRAIQGQAMQLLRDWILQDWQGAVVSVYANPEGLWVVRFDLESVESDIGLATYMNIFIRCNALVNKYGIVKVVENWNVKPGDGHIYFAVRPPWVRTDKYETFLTLHPEERSFKSIKDCRQMMAGCGGKPISRGGTEHTDQTSLDCSLEDSCLGDSVGL